MGLSSPIALFDPDGNVGPLAASTQGSLKDGNAEHAIKEDTGK